MRSAERAHEHADPDRPDRQRARSHPARPGAAADYAWRMARAGGSSPSEASLERDAQQASAGAAAASTGPLLPAGGHRRGSSVDLGRGDPVDSAALGPYPGSLGQSASGIHAHTGPEADTAATLLSARAFTVGDSIAFRSGAYSPGTPTGRSLMGHELSHVSQQRAGYAPGIQRDATNQSLTPGYARALDDGELLHQIELAEQLMRETDPGSDTVQALAGNLQILRDEYWTRDPGANAVTYGPPPGPVTSTGPGAIPEGGEDVGRVGLVAWDGQPELRLRSAPDTSSPDNIIGSLPFNSRIQVVKRFPDDWYFVSTTGGALGYVAASYVWLDLPEPMARVHRVESGVSGTAIAIAERYYGEYADDWGQDLRFYVNVLAWANGISVPDTTSGWRQVHFQAGKLIWVPSQPFARTLKGVVNSGSYSYNIADFLGVAEFIERVAELWDDFWHALDLSKQYVVDAIVTQLGHTVVALLEGLAYLVIGAAAILAISTAVGAALGALAGGVGAAPGAAAGFEVGMVIIEWLGLAMLAYWIAESLVSVASAFGSFLGMVWDARGDVAILDQAARQFANAVALLLGKLLEALFMYLTAKGLPKALESIRGTRAGQAMGETNVARWLSERAAAVEAGEAPLRSPQQVLGGGGRPAAERADVTVNGQGAAFHNLPPDRLPGGLPQGHFWMRTPEGQWVLMREAGAPQAPFELSVYSDAAGRTNYVLRTGDRVIQSDAISRSGGTYQSGQQRLPPQLEGTGAQNPYRDPVTGQVRYDKGHGVDYADTLEGPGVRSSTTDPANFTPQAPWWNQGPRNTLVRWIREGHPTTGRPGGGGYREMALYDASPPRVADGTPIPREFVFVETNGAGVPQRAWRVPNDPALTNRTVANMAQYEVPLSQVPPAMIRPNASLQARGPDVSFLPGIVFGVPGDHEGADAGQSR